jgi:TolA-binding protein
MCVVFFVAAPKLGVVDIRYIPYGHLLGSLLAAITLGWLGLFLRRWRIDWVLLPVALVAAIVWTANQAGPSTDWAKWNYEGFEAKAAWPVFKKINSELKGDFSDPRVVYEHSELHNSFGSSRAFESLPLFAGRATLEGLYMQASISAPFVFYIQSLVSQQKSVPFPQYSYSSLNYDRARPRLEMFNVRDLIIRSDNAKKAIRQSEDYQLKNSIGEYELWELTTNRNRFVDVLDYEPVLFPTSSWKMDSHRWFLDDSLLQTPLVFVKEEVTQSFEPFKIVARGLTDIPRMPVDAGDCNVQEYIGNQEIRIETDCIGKPLIVKMSYHPDWHVEGADHIYLVSPSFMLVYPQQSHVRLYYGPGLWDRIGLALTIAGLFVLLINIPLPWLKGCTCWQLIAARLNVRSTLVPKFGFDPDIRSRWIMLILVLAISGSAIVWSSYVVYHSNPNRIHNNSIFLKDERRYDEAREGFRKVIEELAASNLAQDAAYYIGITYFLEKKDEEAIAAFEALIRRYPTSNWVPEAEYHIGKSLYRLGREDEGNRQMQQLQESYPGSRWSVYAGRRISEHEAKQVIPAPLDEDNIDYYMGIAIDHFNHDRLEEAKSLLQDISGRFPDHVHAPQALAALALVYYKQGDCQMTLAHYGELVKRYPGDKLVPEAYYHLGLCNQRLGNLEKGQDYLSRVAREYPDTVYGRQARERLH